MENEAAHLQAIHELAESRRQRGQPLWDEVIDASMLNDPTLSFDDIRDKIVENLRASKWLKDNPHPSVERAVDALVITGNDVEFDAIWNRIYDLADIDRVWLDTVKKEVLNEPENEPST